MEDKDSIVTAKSALKLAISSRKEEERLKKTLLKDDIKTAAVDFGGEFNDSIADIIKNAVVAAKREKLIRATHVHQGAVAGATHDALNQVLPSASGLNIGGKIGIARHQQHVVVAVFFGVGMLHLNEVAVGLSHRTID